MFVESDSLYAIKCASEWVVGWRRNGWRTTSGSPVKNADIIQGIDTAIISREGPVRFRWVRGHVGNYFNEKADALAGEAAREAAAADAVAGANTAEMPAVAAEPKPEPVMPLTLTRFQQTLF
jgi:ribonuclease HI